MCTHTQNCGCHKRPGVRIEIAGDLALGDLELFIATAKEGGLKSSAAIEFEGRALFAPVPDGGVQKVNDKITVYRTTP
jgi:hypothetical protein